MLCAGLWSCDREENNGNNNEGNNGGGTAYVTWVDLGLPSGLLWADRNVGAENPEDKGNYYAWGETAPKEVYYWDNYAYGDYGELTKYCTMSEYGLNGFTDNLTTLEASDDAASVNIGDKARTPRDYEWEELMENTTGTWTTRNGIYGYKLTASNGKSIFLPTTGTLSGSNLYDDTYGSYWSATLTLDQPNFTRELEFWSSGWRIGGDGGERYYGHPVRAVRDR